MASDRCAVELGNARSSSQLCKIYTSGANVFAFSGDDTALRVAEELKLKWDKEPSPVDPISTTLRQVAEETYRRDASELGADQWEKVRTWARSTIAIVGGLLWRIDIGATSTVKQILDKNVAGDFSNTSRFLSEQYYEPDRTIAELVVLAAHVIVMGHERNHDNVRGLDIAVWTADDNELRLYGKPELEMLSARSKQVDSDLRKMIYQA